MLGFFGNANHFPHSGKNCFIALLLPEIDIKLPVRVLASDNPATELARLVVALQLICVAVRLHKLLSLRDESHSDAKMGHYSDKYPTPSP